MDVTKSRRIAGGASQLRLRKKPVIASCLTFLAASAIVWEPVVQGYLIPQKMTRTLSFTSIPTKDCGDVKMLVKRQRGVTSTHIQLCPKLKRRSMQKFMTLPYFDAFSGKTVTSFSSQSQINGCTFGLARKIALLIHRHVRLSTERAQL